MGNRESVTDLPHERLGERLGDLLVRSGRITSAQLEAALELQSRENLLLGQALINFGAITESELAKTLRDQGKLPCVRLIPGILDPVVARGLDRETAERLSAIPVNRIAGISTVAMVDPRDLNCVDEIANTLKTRVLPVHASPQQIADCLEFIHSGGEPALDPALDRGRPADSRPGESHLAPPAIQILSELLTDAARRGATSIHLEPRQQGFVVRFRIDGLLTEQLCLDRNRGPECVARLKSMAGLELSENRRIQEGCARDTLEGQPVELRVATTPCRLGEGAVIRIIEGDQTIAALDALGLERGQLGQLREMLTDACGLLLAAGPAESSDPTEPTGSGRTDLLYSVMAELNQPQRKLVTLEDPVRHTLDGVTQIPVDARFGLGFAGGLRSILRQDPDVILVGEIRDAETAVAATQAALSGRMLLSTIEAAGPLETIARFLDLGVEPLALADAFCGVVAQRTVRSICRECRRLQKPEPDLFRRLDCEPFEAWQGAGCDRCGRTGYQGRTGIRELLSGTPELRQAIRRSAGPEALRQAARAAGGLTFRADGLRLARAGKTTLEEVLAATDGSRPRR